MVDKYGNYHITAKGYPRYHSGAYRNQFVHRVHKAKHLGRPLKKDEDVHHVNGNKLDYSRTNLKLMGHRDHGWVSAKQNWYMKRKEEREHAEHLAYLAQQDEIDTRFP